MKPPVRGSPARPRSERAAPLVRRRRGDPEPLGDVVDHEADDQERAERQLPEREGRADRQPLAEVVQADPDRDERRERHPAERAAALPAEKRVEMNVIVR